MGQTSPHWARAPPPTGPDPNPLGQTTRPPPPNQGSRLLVTYFGILRALRRPHLGVPVCGGGGRRPLFLGAHMLNSWEWSFGQWVSLFALSSIFALFVCFLVFHQKHKDSIEVNIKYFPSCSTKSMLIFSLRTSLHSITSNEISWSVNLPVLWGYLTCFVFWMATQSVSNGSFWQFRSSVLTKYYLESSWTLSCLINFRQIFVKICTPFQE